MNLDDFLHPSSIASPVGLSPSPSGEKMLHSSTAIPIRKVFNLDQPDHLSRTAPLSAPLRSEAEFGYVQRHVRKTSIDERRVQCPPALPVFANSSCSLPNGEPMPRHKCLLSTALCCPRMRRPRRP